MVTPQELRAAVAEGISGWRPSIMLDNRTIYGIMTRAEHTAKRY